MPDWKAHLRNLYDRLEPASKQKPAAANEVRQFLHETVEPALQDVRREMEQYGRKTVLHVEDDRVELEVQHRGDAEFCYGVHLRRYRRPKFAFPEMPDADSDDAFYRAEVYLDDEAQGYGIGSYSRERVINHVLHEYERRVRWKKPAKGK